MMINSLWLCCCHAWQQWVATASTAFQPSIVITHTAHMAVHRQYSSTTHGVQGGMHKAVQHQCIYKLSKSHMLGGSSTHRHIVHAAGGTIAVHAHIIKAVHMQHTPNCQPRTSAAAVDNRPQSPQVACLSL